MRLGRVHEHDFEAILAVVIVIINSLCQDPIKHIILGLKRRSRQRRRNDEVASLIVRQLVIRNPPFLKIEVMHLGVNNPPNGIHARLKHFIIDSQEKDLPPLLNGHVLDVVAVFHDLMVLVAKALRI